MCLYSSIWSFCVKVENIMKILSWLRTYCYMLNLHLRRLRSCVDNFVHKSDPNIHTVSTGTIIQVQFSVEFYIEFLPYKSIFFGQLIWTRFFSTQVIAIIFTLSHKFFIHTKIQHGLGKKLSVQNLPVQYPPWSNPRQSPYHF